MSNHAFALVLLGAVWLSVALAVAVDAARRGWYGSVWGSTTFLLGPLGLVIYALAVLSAAARPDEDGGAGRADEDADGPTANVVRSGSRAYCGDCNARVAFDAERCRNCGSTL